MRASQGHGSRRRGHLALGLCRVCVTLSILLGGAARVAGASDWFPLDAGRTLLYATHRDRMIERPGEPLARQFFLGTVETSVLGSTASDAGRIQLRVVRSEREANLSSAARPDAGEIQIYSTHGHDVLLHAQIRPGAKPERVAYDPPVEILKGPLEPGRAWHVGVLREGRLEIDAHAEVVGRESVTVAGQRYPETAHVRLRGDVRGSLGSDDDRFTVRQGRFTQDLWLARGTGPVREVTSLDLQLGNDGSESMRLSDVATRTLQTAVASGAADAEARDGAGARRP